MIIIKAKVKTKDKIMGSLMLSKIIDLIITTSKIKVKVKVKIKINLYLVITKNNSNTIQVSKSLQTNLGHRKIVNTLINHNLFPTNPKIITTPKTLTFKIVISNI